MRSVNKKRKSKKNLRSASDCTRARKLSRLRSSFFFISSSSPIGGLRGELYFFACLREKFLRSSCMTAQVVIIVVLRRVNFLPCLLDHLLGSSHVSMPFTNIDSWPLGKSDYTKDDNGNDKQTFVNHGVPPGCECGFKTARALAI